MFQPEALDEMVYKFRPPLNQDGTVLGFEKELPYLFRSPLVFHAQSWIEDESEIGMAGSFARK